MKTALVSSLVSDPHGRSIQYIPLGLMSIAACLRRQGIHEAQVVDLSRRLRDSGDYLSARFYEETAQSLLREGHRVIGFSSASTSFHHVVSLAERIKRLDSSVIVVVGGPGPYSFKALVGPVLTNFRSIDYVIAGEGEIVFPQLLSRLERGEGAFGLPGVSFRDGDTVVVGKRPSLITALDDLPSLAFESLEAADYLFAVGGYERVLHIEEGRGCPFRCTFCSTSGFWERLKRRRSARRIIADMRLLNDMYSITNFSLVDDCFNSDQRYVLDFCNQMMLEGCSYVWGCSVRADLLTENVLDRMWCAGCRGFFAGIESGSERVQRLVNKNLNVPTALARIEYAARKGFRIVTSLIVGFPEEEATDLQATSTLHKQLLDIGVAESNVNVLVPLPGSALTESEAYELEYDGFSTFPAAVLDEHSRLIRKYPRIFSSFYYFKTKHVSRQALVETALLSHALASLYR